MSLGVGVTILALVIASVRDTCDRTILRISSLTKAQEPGRVARHLRHA